MKLEQEIKQERFRSEYHKLALNLTFTHFWLFDKYREILKPYGISIQQFNILRILKGQHPKPSTINLLKERMLDKSSDASRLVERLRLKGLVDRELCPSDRRSVDIMISEKGLKLIEEIDKKQDLLDNPLKNLTEDEAGLVNKLLDKMRD